MSGFGLSEERGHLIDVSISCRVPLAIVNKAHQANQIYPFAISLIESVRTYERTLEKVSERPQFSAHCIAYIVSLWIIITLLLLISPSQIKQTQLATD